MAWAPLLQLSRMARLRSLSVGFLPDGAGLQYLARSVDGLSGLQSLHISFDEPPTPDGAFLAGLSFIGRLVGLSCLKLCIVQTMAPPPWLSSLTALSSLQANLRVRPSDIATLAALPALRELIDFACDAGGGGALPAACCPSVAVLQHCRIEHTGLAALAAAFPMLTTAGIRIFGGDDEEAPHPAAMPAALAPWRSLQTLQIEGFELLDERHIRSAFNALLALLRGASELTTLELTSVEMDEEFDDDDIYPRTGWRDADVAALLAHAPATLESLKLCPVASLTDAAFAGCPPLPALKTLHLHWMAPLRLTPGGLLALGRAMPGLERLCLSAEPFAQGIGGDEQSMAWIAQLDALGGGAQPAEGSGNALLLAIRSALAREVAAGARLA